MNKKNKLVVTLCTIILSLGSAMAEDLAEGHGPRAGYIAKAADFTTELVPDAAAGGYRVYVLDTNWAEKDIAPGKIALAHIYAKNKSGAKCEKQMEGFLCTLSTKPKEGDQLTVKVEGNTKLTGETKYRLPLRHAGEATPPPR